MGRLLFSQDQPEMDLQEKRIECCFVDRILSGLASSKPSGDRTNTFLQAGDFFKSQVDGPVVNGAATGAPECIFGVMDKP